MFLSARYLFLSRAVESCLLLLISTVVVETVVADVGVEMDDRKSGLIVDLSSYRRKKEVEQDLADGRRPLFVSHLDRKMTGTPHLRRPAAEDFGDRLQRIKSSLERINNLMAELKKSADSEPSSERAVSLH